MIPLSAPLHTEVSSRGAHIQALEYCIMVQWVLGGKERLPFSPRSAWVHSRSFNDIQSIYPEQQLLRLYFVHPPPRIPSS